MWVRTRSRSEEDEEEDDDDEKKKETCLNDFMVSEIQGSVLKYVAIQWQALLCDTNIIQSRLK